jgi:putative SOS response-associated peptidase YedK
VPESSDPESRTQLGIARCNLPVGHGNVHITPWRKVNGKTPYYFQLKDQSPVAFAGLWERWDKGEEPIESCTLITAEANAVVGQVHGRMPVILESGSFDRWLDPNEQRADVLQAMITPLPDDCRLTNHRFQNESPKRLDAGRLEEKSGVVP